MSNEKLYEFTPKAFEFYNKWINQLVSGGFHRYTGPTGRNHRVEQIEWIKHKNEIINLDFLGGCF